MKENSAIREFREFQFVRANFPHFATSSRLSSLVKFVKLSDSVRRTVFDGIKISQEVPIADSESSVAVGTRTRGEEKLLVFLEGWQVTKERQLTILPGRR